MKYIFYPLLAIFYITNAVADWDYSPRVETEFKNFFGESVNTLEIGHRVKIIGEKISERPESGMPLTLKFDVGNVEKVLLLNAGGNHYSYSGTRSDECAKEPVKLYSYVEKTKNHPKQLKLILKTKCKRHQVTFLLWVRTVDGQYHHNYFTFNTTTSRQEN